MRQSHLDLDLVGGAESEVPVSQNRTQIQNDEVTPIDPSRYIQNLKKISPRVWQSNSNEELQIHYPADQYEVNALVENKSFWFNHRNKCIVRIVKNFPSDGPIFDVGGGTGIVSSALEEAQISTVLIEPGTPAVKIAENKTLSLPIVKGHFSELAIEPETLPAVALFDVLEHIENDFDFLTTITSRLISGGRIYITVPSYSFLWSEEDSHAGHFRRYNKNNIKNLLGRCGLTIEFSTNLFSYLILPVLISRTIPYLLGLKRRHQSYQKDHSNHDSFWIRILNRYELSRLCKNRTIHFGTSILIVARK